MPRYRSRVRSCRDVGTLADEDYECETSTRKLSQMEKLLSPASSYLGASSLKEVRLSKHSVTCPRIIEQFHTLLLKELAKPKIAVRVEPYSS